MESEGCLSGADSSTVSERARVRGADQLGTLGSGNHFLEVQRVAKIIDPQAAEGFGLRQDQVTVLIHSGSRGFGHQVCSEYVRTMDGVRARYRITLPDRQLACAPLSSAEGRRYMRAMACGELLPSGDRAVLAHRIARVGGADPRARGGRENAPGLRRGPQRRQARDPPRAGTVRAPQGRDEGFPRGIGRDPRVVPRRGSARCSSPARWGRSASCWSAPGRDGTLVRHHLSRGGKAGEPHRRAAPDHWRRAAPPARGAGDRCGLPSNRGLAAGRHPSPTKTSSESSRSSRRPG